MVTSFPSNARLAALVAIAALAQPAGAVMTGSRLPITLDADSSDIDRRADRLVFKGVTISQGDLGIQADEAVASTLDFANSEWTFTGHVRISMRNATLSSDAARMKFAGYQLQSARIEGQPATFRQVETDNSVTEGRAQVLEYDAGQSTVRLSRNAWLSEGGNEISGNVLTYNMAEERVIAGSDVETGERVRILITPEGVEQVQQKRSQAPAEQAPPDAEPSAQPPAEDQAPEPESQPDHQPSDGDPPHS